MACDFITAGKDLPCKDSVGGLKNVYFAQYGIDIAKSSDDSVASSEFTGSTFYQYELKGNSSLTQNIQTSRENGTTAFEQVLELTLPKLSAADNQAIKLLAFGRPHIVVEDYNGNFFVVGREHGADVTGGTIVTGAAMGDLSGYTLTFTAMERTPANVIPGTVGTDSFLDTATIPAN
jgi:hypothetical protein